MKNMITAVILLLLTSGVFAQESLEHIDHAQDRLMKSAIHTTNLLNQYSKIERDCDLSWMDNIAATNWLYIRLYAEKVHNEALQISYDLDDPAISLQESRRFLSSESDWELNNPRVLPLSVLKRTRTVSIMIVQANSGAAKSNADCVYKFGALQLPLANSWMYLDEALWHIDDAIATE